MLILCEMDWRPVLLYWRCCRRTPTLFWTGGATGAGRWSCGPEHDTSGPNTLHTADTRVELIAIADIPSAWTYQS